MKKLQFITLVLFTFTLQIFAQKPSTTIELMAGNERMYYNLGISAKVAENLNFSSVTGITAEYDFKKSLTEIVSSNSLIYSFNRYIGLGTGIQWHFKKGIVPNVSTQIAYGNPNFLFVFAPQINFMPWIGSDLVAIAEYKPQINDQFRLFTRAQALYSYNIKDSYHERSFYNFRLGLSHKNIAFGAATNIDYYGGRYFNRNNYGAFVRVGL